MIKRNGGICLGCGEIMWVPANEMAGCYHKKCKNKKEKLFVMSTGESQKTLDAWTGGLSFIHKFEINIFGWHIVFWRKI